jgi:hypothetical protein
MSSWVGFDLFHILGHAANLETFAILTMHGNDLDNLHIFSLDLVERCPASDIYSLSSILKIPLLT